MSDRELLELAAKAAGMRVEWIGDNAFDCTNLKPEKRAYQGDMWSPLWEDGDALRLAVKLRISLSHQQEYMGGPVLEFVEAKTPHTANSFPESFEECLTDRDEMEATRRAIVRAAAAMEKRPQPVKAGG